MSRVASMLIINGTIGGIAISVVVAHWLLKRHRGGAV